MRNKNKCSLTVYNKTQEDSYTALQPYSMQLARLEDLISSCKITEQMFFSPHTKN
jgi:hypothetical protein